MHAFTLIFLAALGASVALKLWLAARHVRHVLQHRDHVPAPFRERIPPEAHRKAADYTAARTRLQQAETLFNGALVLAWTLGGGLDHLDRFWHGFGLDPVATGVGVILSVLLITALLELPFSAYRTFRIESRFGFNRTTPGLFFADLLKETLLTLALGAPLAWTVLWLMEQAGPAWWIYAWLVWVGFGLLLTWAYPAFIAPLFNRFTPLADEDLKRRVEGLLARCGFTSKGVFVMDGSRRSSHGNAYFTGLGANKRIVFFDTLLDSLEPPEIEAVLAHELGHFRRRHVVIRLALSALLSLAGLMVLGWLMEQPWFFTALGVGEPSTHTALILFLMVAPAFVFFLQPALAWFSRRHEFEADEYAARHTDPAALIRALVKLYRDNAATLTPDPLYSMFHDSHPPAPVRLARLAAKPREANG